jgi:hypothetical protein
MPAVELEQAQRAVEQPEPRTARDAERQELLRRWLELRMAKEKEAADAKRKRPPRRPTARYREKMFPPLKYI